MPEECDREPCGPAVQALGSAKDEYNATKEDLYQLAAALGFTGGASVAVLVAWVAATVAAGWVPVVGWILVGASAALLGALASAYVAFRRARSALRAAKETVRQACPRACWPDNVLRED